MNTNKAYKIRYALIVLGMFIALTSWMVRPGYADQQGLYPKPGAVSTVPALPPDAQNLEEQPSGEPFPDDSLVPIPLEQVEPDPGDTHGDLTRDGGNSNQGPTSQARKPKEQPLVQTVQLPNGNFVVSLIGFNGKPFSSYVQKPAIFQRPDGTEFVGPGQTIISYHYGSTTTTVMLYDKSGKAVRRIALPSR